MDKSFLTIVIILISAKQVICFLSDDPLRRWETMAVEEESSKEEGSKEKEPHKFLQRQMDNMSLPEYKQGCGTAIDLEDRGPTLLTTPVSNKGIYATGIDCEWTIVGHRECIPQIKCDYFDMRKIKNKCDEEFLFVQDGLGGQQILCGNNNPFERNFIGSTVSYELFFRLKIAKEPKFNRNYKGFKCLVSCFASVGQLPVNAKFRKIENKCTCGMRKLVTMGKIVGGLDADIEEFPWQAAMVETATRKIRCGASLINDRFVLTAAHCLFYRPGVVLPTADIQILFHARILDFNKQDKWEDIPLGQAGSIRGPGWNLSKVTDQQERTVRMGVAKIIPNLAYDERTLDYDIALLQLAKPVNMRDPKLPLTPICLPPQGQDEKVLLKKMLTVAGWGLPHELAGASTRLLQKGSLPFQATPHCEKVNDRTLTDRMICAGFPDGQKDACTGDSGGALFDEGDRKNWQKTQVVQVGIVSHGEGCARKNNFGIYTRVSELVQWIYHNAKDAVWCKDKL